MAYGALAAEGSSPPRKATTSPVVAGLAGAVALIFTVCAICYAYPLADANGLMSAKLSDSDTSISRTEKIQNALNAVRQKVRPRAPPPPLLRAGGRGLILTPLNCCSSLPQCNTHTRNS